MSAQPPAPASLDAPLDALTSSLLDATPVGVLALDSVTGAIVYANAAARGYRASAAPGAPPEPLEGRLAGEAFPWVDERALALARAVAETGESLRRRRVERGTGDGLTVWEYDLAPLPPLRDGTTGVVALTFTDRTEEWRANQRAEGAIFTAQLYAERLEAVIEQIPDAVLITDERGRLVAYNPAALALARNASAVERARIRGRRLEPVWELCWPDGPEVREIELPTWRAMLTGAPLVGSQLSVRGQDGAEAPLLVNATPLRDEGGAIQGAVAVLRDISDVKRLERLKDEFISVASHELRQPLTVIQGQAQLLKRRLRPRGGDPSASFSNAAHTSPEALRQIIEGIESQTHRLNLLVSDLLDASRIDTGQLRLEPERGPLLPLVRHVMGLQRQTTTEHTLTLDVALPDGVDELEGVWDSRRIEQILMNLLSNAIKYSPEGGVVRVTVDALPEGRCVAPRAAQLTYAPHERQRSVAGPAAHIVVADAGIGIPPEELGQLFERFYRAHNTGGIQGTGLGLYICRQLAWASGGDLWVESAGIGHGSAFHLALPLAGSLVKDYATSSPAPASSSSTTPLTGETARD